MTTEGLFTWSGGPRSSGVGVFCFHALGDAKQKKPTPLDGGPPLHVNRVLVVPGKPKRITSSIEVRKIDIAVNKLISLRL